MGRIIVSVQRIGDPHQRDFDLADDVPAERIAATVAHTLGWSREGDDPWSLFELEVDGSGRPLERDQSLAAAGARDGSRLVFRRRGSAEQLPTTPPPSVPPSPTRPAPAPQSVRATAVTAPLPDVSRRRIEPVGRRPGVLIALGFGLLIVLALLYRLIVGGGDNGGRDATASALALAATATDEANALAATASYATSSAAAAGQTAAAGTAIASATGEAAAAATGTASAAAAATATAAAVATRTEAAQAAAAETATSSVQQTAAAATAAAEQMAAATATASAAAAALAAAEAQAELAYGPADGSLRHDTTDPSVKSTYAPGEFAADLIVEARFVNPYDATEAAWDEGFFFRETGDHLYRIFVASSGNWSLERWSSADDAVVTVASGPVPNLDTAANRSNLIRIVAHGDAGWLFVNDNFVGTFDLSAIDGGGEVGIGTGFGAGRERDGAETRYESWAIWNVQAPAVRTATAAAAAATTDALTATASAIASAIAAAEAKADLAYGPDAGSLQHEPNDNQIEAKVAPGTYTADVIVEARFVNPYPADEHAWDYGFVIRHTDAAEYRVYLDSAGTWRLDVWKAADGSISTLDEGEAAGADLDAGKSNLMRLVAEGDRGWLLVNDRVTATFDLSEISTDGLVEVGTGFRAGDERDGAETRYEDWSVWNVLEPAARTATAAAVAASATAAAATASAATATASAVAEEVAHLKAQATLAYGPADGALTTFQFAPNSYPSDFIVQVRLFNPSQDQSQAWIAGIFFRMSLQSGYAVVLNPPGTWTLAITSTSDGMSTIASGRLDNFDPNPGGSNLLRIVAQGDHGWLVVNDDFVAALDLSRVTTGGQIALANMATTGATTMRYESWTIWTIEDAAQRTATAEAAAVAASAAAATASAAASAIAEAEAQATLAFGPQDGRLTHVEAGNSMSLEIAPVAFAPDLIAEARFFNPYDPAEHPWDYGFLFRFDGVRNYRVFLDSQGTWNLDLWTGTAASSLASGQAPGVDLSPGGSNVLRLTVQGDRGWLAIGGTIVASMDLSAIPSGSQLGVGTGFRIGNERDGAETRYEAWSVWNVLQPDARTATAAAAATSTAQAMVMATTAAGVNATAIAEAQRYWGPRDGSLTHIPDNNQIEYWGVPVAVPDDFIGETRFFNPYDAASHAWDFGLFFRGSSSGQYGIVVDSSRHWELTIGRSTGWQSLASGEAPSLDVSPLGSNTLRLVVRGKEGFFFVNGAFVARLDLSDLEAGGLFGVGIDFRIGNSQDGAVTRFQDLTVWAIVAPAAATATASAQQQAQGTAYAIATEVASRGTVVAGPDAGTLPHDPAAIKIAQTWANVGVQNFVVEARFFNPYDRLLNAWDYGFGFRETAFNQQYAIVLDSDGFWQLMLFEGSAEQPRVTTLATGQGVRFDDTVDGHNDLRLVVRDGAADFYVNDRFVATIDVSAKIVAGRVSVGTGFTPGRVKAGAETRYEGFTIWSLDPHSPGDGAASPRALDATPTASPTGTPSPTPTPTLTPSPLPSPTP
jgi:hypothetical protein